MKIKVLLLSLLFPVITATYGQDAYHTALSQELTEQYELPVPTFVIGNTETSILAAAYNWGSQRTDSNVDGQAFTRQSRLVVSAAGTNAWDAGFFAQNTQAVALGDKLFWVAYIRSEGGNGTVSIIAENTTTFNKEVNYTIPISINWTRVLVAFEALNSSYTPGQLQFGFHLAHQAQDVRIGGFTVVNLGQDVELEDIPSDFNPENYGGNEADAAWRAPAADRIDQLRKANLTINATDLAGNPVDGALVEVNMQQHEFAFGTAIKACRLPGNNCSNVIFQNKLVNLDGEGHGFNWVVFENDLKWPAWEEEWLATNAEVVSAVSWLRERNIKIRGHNLLWPGNGNLPDDVNVNRNDTSYVLNRINTHIETLADYPGLAGQIADWDVINETVTNTTLENSFQGQGDFTTGRELYQRVFEKARQENPGVGLYLNDYVTLSTGALPSSGSYQTLKRNLGEIVFNAPIDGIGFQGHIGAFPNDINTVLETYDDFYNSYGLDAKITEFDLPASVDNELAAKYLEDFLTATFSHESMNGFMFWNFWDVDTWQSPGANLFRSNWEQSPAGDAFIAKVFDEWWTEETAETDANGIASVRGFKGTYEVTYQCGGETVTEEVVLSEDASIDIRCDDFLNDLEDEFDNIHQFKVSPNPNNGQFIIDQPFGDEIEARLINSLGQVSWVATLKSQLNTVSLDVPAGTYVLQLQNGGRWSAQRLVVE